MSFKRAVSVEEIPAGSTAPVEIDEERVLICRLENGDVHVVQDQCSHDGGVLGEGVLSGKVIECPRHGARFDVTTGSAVRMPAVAPIERFASRLSDDGWIEIDVEGGG